MAVPWDQCRDIVLIARHACPPATEAPLRRVCQNGFVSPLATMTYERRSYRNKCIRRATRSMTHNQDMWVLPALARCPMMRRSNSTCDSHQSGHGRAIAKTARRGRAPPGSKASPASIEARQASEATAAREVTSRHGVSTGKRYTTSEPMTHQHRPSSRNEWKYRLGRRTRTALSPMPSHEQQPWDWGLRNTRQSRR